MTDGESPRRRDVLRAGTAAGLAALGWPASAASTQETTTEQDQQSEYAFSYSLQQGDRFQVQSRLRNPDGDPATESVPAACLDGGERQYPVFVVRAYRQGIRLGYEGVFVPEEAAAEATGTTTTEADEDGETATEEGEGEAETPTTTTEADEEEETTTTATEAALQDETTPTEDGNETDTTAGTETTVDTTETGTTTEGEDEEGETTTTETDTTTATTETPTETPEQAAGLPDIRVGDWYRVASMSKCDSVSRLSLEPAEPPETTAAASEP